MKYWGIYDYSSIAARGVTAKGLRHLEALPIERLRVDSRARKAGHSVFDKKTIDQGDDRFAAWEKHYDINAR